MAVSQSQLAVNIQQLALLYQLQAILTNLETSLTLIEQGNIQKQVVVSNGNLYKIAAEQYGDATKWTAIAAANGLSDPLVQGGNVIYVTVTNGGNGYINPIVNFIGNVVVPAVATAVVNNGVITAVKMVVPGSYIGPVAVSFIDLKGNNATATATCAFTLKIPKTANSTGGILQ